MIDKDKVVKLDLCTLKGAILLTVTKNYTFPFKIGEDEETAESQSVIVKDKSGRLPVFARNAPIRLIAHTKSGDRISYPGRIELSMESQLNVYLRTNASEVMEDRRRFYKVAEKIPCNITVITRGEKATALNPPLEFIILDINIGGIFIEHNKQVELKQEDTITVEIPEVCKETAFISKVLRVVTTPDGVIKGYGCQFPYLSTGQEELLSGFINKLQLERRKLERAEAVM